MSIYFPCRAGGACTFKMIKNVAAFSIECLSLSFPWKGSKEDMNYALCPTTVFTPIEYGACGFRYLPVNCTY